MINPNTELPKLSLFSKNDKSKSEPKPEPKPKPEPELQGRSDATSRLPVHEQESEDGFLSANLSGQESSPDQASEKSALSNKLPPERSHMEMQKSLPDSLDKDSAADSSQNISGGDDSLKQESQPSKKAYVDSITDDILNKSSTKDPFYRTEDQESQNKEKQAPKKEKSKRSKSKKKVHCSLQAYQLNNIFFASYASLAGTAQALPSPAERVELDEALEHYLIETQVQFSPGFVLCMAYGGFIMKSLNKPVVKHSLLQRLSLLFKKIKDMIFKRKEKIKTVNITNSNNK